MRETEVTKFPNYRWDSFREGRGSWEGKLKIDAGAPVRCWRKGLSWRVVESRCFKKFCLFNVLRTWFSKNSRILNKNYSYIVENSSVYAFG